MWPLCDVVKDSLWVVVVEQNRAAAVTHEGDGEAFQTSFSNNNGGDGIFINPWSLLRMRAEKPEAAWLTICFESTSQSSQLYDFWV